jgi:hypothetical protein
MAKKCAFCPEDAVEKGGEHLWDDWLNKALPETLYRARRQYSLDSPVIEFDSDSLTEKLPVVCEKCNSGWMSTLTEKVQLVFNRTILEGEPFSLGPKDAELLAAFTFMKAVVTNHAIDYDPFFTRADRERFRTERAVPPLLKMWFARFQGAARMSTKNNISIISQNEDPDGPLYGLEFCSHTYVVGQLVLQLLAPRWKKLSDRGKPLITLSPHASWNAAATLFWPHAGGLLSWPPSKWFADDAIQEFIYRFKQPVHIHL